MLIHRRGFDAQNRREEFRYRAPALTFVASATVTIQNKHLSMDRVPSTQTFFLEKTSELLSGSTELVSTWVPHLLAERRRVAR